MWQTWTVTLKRPWLRSLKNLLYSILEKDLLFAYPHFCFMSEHCWGKRGRSMLDTLMQAGPRFAVTVAASAICLSLYQCPQLLHSVHHFSFLFLIKCTLKNKIGRKYYIRLRYTTQRFSICSYFEMVTTLSQHPTLNVDTESFFLVRWSFKICSFPSGVK